MDRLVECPYCGAENDPARAKCVVCGRPMSHEHVKGPGANVCIHCGKPIEEGAELCNACTRPARAVIMSNLPKEVGETECVHWSEKPAAAGRSARVIMAGILILMAGALGIGQAVIAVDMDLSESLAGAVEGLVPGAEAMDGWVTDYVVLQAWVLIAGVLAIAGGMFALTGTRFEFALMGGVFGLLAIGFVVGAFLGLVGLLLIAVSRKEFLPEC